jgi:signal peptidase I
MAIKNRIYSAIWLLMMMPSVVAAAQPTHSLPATWSMDADEDHFNPADYVAPKPVPGLMVHGYFADDSIKVVDGKVVLEGTERCAGEIVFEDLRGLPSTLPLAVILSGVSYFLRGHVLDGNYRNFFVASKNMDPTLVEGDRLVAKMSGCSQIFRGDVVLTVEEAGGAGQSLSIRRIAAIPGDRFSMKKGVVFINRKPVSLQPLPDVERDDYGTTRRIKRFREQFPGEASGHEILDIFEESPFDDFAEVKLGEDQYFLLGDNRDNSTDSRMGKDMFGPGIVHRSQIKGRVLFRYWRTGLGLQEGKF